MVQKYATELQNQNTIQYIVNSKERYLHCKKIVLPPSGTQNIAHYAYLFHDYDRQITDVKAYCERINLQNQAVNVKSDETQYFGKFMLYSNYDIDSAEAHNIYIQRQEIEQAFDFWKDINHLLPLREHSTQSVHGQILLSFISTVLHILLNKKFANTKYGTLDAMSIMSKLDVKIYPNMNIAEPLTPEQKKIAIILKLDLEQPVQIELDKTYTNPYLRSLMSRRNRGRPKGRNNNKQLVFKKKNLSDPKTLDENKDKQNEEYTDKAQIINPLKKGRSKGSKNKTKIETKSSISSLNPVKSRRGRPKGSKNKTQHGATVSRAQTSAKTKNNELIKGNKNKL
jgi:hypothetical protein